MDILDQINEMLDSLNEPQKVIVDVSVRDVYGKLIPTSPGEAIQAAVGAYVEHAELENRAREMSGKALLGVTARLMGILQAMEVELRGQDALDHRTVEKFLGGTLKHEPMGDELGQELMSVAERGAPYLEAMSGETPQDTPEN